MSELASGLHELARLVPYIKRVKLDKLRTRLQSEAEYDDLFPREEIEELLRDVVSYYIDPEKCQACMICGKRCPVECIDGARNLVHIVDQDEVRQVRNLLRSVPASIRRGDQAVRRAGPGSHRRGTAVDRQERQGRVGGYPDVLGAALSAPEFLTGRPAKKGWTGHSVRVYGMVAYRQCASAEPSVHLG